MLDKYRLYKSTNLSEIRRKTSEKIRDHRIDVVVPSEPINAHHNVAELDGLKLHVIQYGMTSVITCDPLSEFYLLVMPVSGEITLTVAHLETLFDTESAAIIPNDQRFSLHWQAGAEVVVLQVEKKRLEKKLQSFLGFAVERRVRFDQRIDTSSGAGSFLRATLLMIINQLDENPWDEIGPLLANEFSEALLATLLRSDFHNYYHLLVGGESHSDLPTVMKSAIAFVRSNLKEAIGTEEIAAAVGVGERTLQSIFKRHIEMSPSHYLRVARLAEIRRELLDERTKGRCSVTDIAQKWGFNHFGRFSAYYKDAYDELPSDTLKRSVTLKS